MNYFKFLFCMIACLCLTCCSARGQCPPGYVDINTSLPSYEPPNWIEPGDALFNPCWEAFNATINSILSDFIACQKEKSPAGYPFCTTAEQKNMCEFIMTAAFNQAFDAYVDCIFTNYPPPSDVTPPPGISCPSGFNCIPPSAEDALTILLPWEGFDENDECYGTYVYNMKLLHKSYINGIVTCDHVGFYCWSCTCVEFWKETYQNEAEDLYEDYLNCLFGA